MTDVSNLSSLFEKSISVGVIILLFAILYFLIRKMMENLSSFHEELESKDAQLIEVIKEFNAIVIKINETNDKKLELIISSNKRVEEKVDKLMDKVDNINKSEK